MEKHSFIQPDNSLQRAFCGGFFYKFQQKTLHVLRKIENF
jgi:hypothetical protein